MSNPSEEDDEGDISSVLIDSTSTSYGDMMMLERVLSLHGGESGEGARNFRIAYLTIAEGIREAIGIARKSLGTMCSSYKG